MLLEDQETGMLHPYAANLLATQMLVEVVQLETEQPPLADANVGATWAHTYIRMNLTAQSLLARSRRNWATIRIT